MDRLKRVYADLAQQSLLSLHSNMDRLKHIRICQHFCQTSKFTFQYGSIKAGRTGGFAPAQESLHSNMDRLKPEQADKARNAYNVYIPIWID